VGGIDRADQRRKGTSGGFRELTAVSRASGALRDIAQGSNGAYDATVGCDASTWLGSANGAQAELVLEAATA
jgi:hypothetical protein